MQRDIKAELKKCINLLGQIIDKNIYQDSRENHLEIGESWNVYHLKKVELILKNIILKIKEIN